LREQGAMFDIIVSDIEMPELDGLGLARAVREGGPWQHLPMIAMSGRAEPGHAQRCRNAGFTNNVGKSDRESLLTALRENLSTPATF
jgi:two-component system chemotaxis sensor kinase CheA